MDIKISEIITTYRKENVFSNLMGKYDFQIKIIIDFHFEGTRHLFAICENYFEKSNFLVEYAFKENPDGSGYTFIENKKNDELCILILNRLKYCREKMIEKYENENTVIFEFIP
jgi:hypothetical protein